MDDTASNFYLTKSGCNFCDDFRIRYKKNINYKSKKDLNELVKKIKRINKNSKYDCIIGVSGGVDSSWVLVKAKEIGLNPLAVHMDNGWNSELAQNNISNLIRKLNVDLYTYVINWPEYRAMMNNLFDADVIDIELLYDNAMLAVNYNLSKKFNVKTILSGMNTSTEGMEMPKNWNWFKYDKMQIKYFSKNIDTKLKTFPSLGTFDFLYHTYIRKVSWVKFLDYFDFNKEKSLEILEKNYGYKRYPYKHYESIFTRFYQGYILPKKFNIDKRKLHLSTLIISNQMSRKEALSIIKTEPYDTYDLMSDINYFLKKMRWSEQKLKKYISRNEIPHLNYPSELKTWERLIKIKKHIRNWIK